MDSARQAFASVFEGLHERVKLLEQERDTLRKTVRGAEARAAATEQRAAITEQRAVATEQRLQRLQSDQLSYAARARTAEKGTSPSDVAATAAALASSIRSIGTAILAEPDPVPAAVPAARGQLLWVGSGGCHGREE